LPLQPGRDGQLFKLLCADARIRAQHFPKLVDICGGPGLPIAGDLLDEGPIGVVEDSAVAGGAHAQLEWPELQKCPGKPDRHWYW
jgi:hypothetical protein